MREPEADPYWQHDFALDLSSLGEQPGFGIRFKAHESPEPDYRLTVALHPLPPPTGEVGVVEEARWEGLRQREIGQAQGWYYPQDATLILWECFLEAHYRRGAPTEDSLHTAIWQGWERWLLSRSHRATRIVTTWEDLYDRPAWQNFLETQDYQPIAPAAFAKEVVSP